MIVKLQKPLFWSHDLEPQVLIYDRSRKFQCMVPYEYKYELLFETCGIGEAKAKFFADVTLCGSDIIIRDILDGDPGW